MEKTAAVKTLAEINKVLASDASYTLLLAKIALLTLPDDEQQNVLREIDDRMYLEDQRQYLAA